MAAGGSGARRSRAQWQSLSARAERGELRVRAFCASQGIGTASFYLGRQRLGEDGEQQAPAGRAFSISADSRRTRAPGGGGWEMGLALGDGLVLHLRRR